MLSDVCVLTFIGTHGITITSVLFDCAGVTSTTGGYYFRTKQYPCGYYIISCASFSGSSLFLLIPFLWLPLVYHMPSVLSFLEVFRYIVANESLSLPTHPSVSPNPLRLLVDSCAASMERDFLKTNLRFPTNAVGFCELLSSPMHPFPRV